MNEEREWETLETVLKRAPVLAALLESPRRKPELVAELDVSRSTVDRAIRSLETEGFVTRVDGGFRTTLAGRLAYEAVESFRERVRATAGVSDLLAHLNVDCDLSPDMLVGAEVYHASQPAPYQAATEIETFVRKADRLEGLSLSISNSSTADLLATQVFDGLEYEVVYEVSLARFIGQHRTEERRRMAETGRYRAYCVDDLPFGLFICHTDETSTAGLTVYNDQNDLRGVIINDDPGAVEWATGVFERYRSAGTDITDALRGGGLGGSFSPSEGDGQRTPDDE